MRCEVIGCLNELFCKIDLKMWRMNMGMLEELGGLDVFVFWLGILGWDGCLYF